MVCVFVAGWHRTPRWASARRLGLRQTTLNQQILTLEAAPHTYRPTHHPAIRRVRGGPPLFTRHRPCSRSTPPLSRLLRQTRRTRESQTIVRVSVHCKLRSVTVDTRGRRTARQADYLTVLEAVAARVPSSLPVRTLPAYWKANNTGRVCGRSHPLQPNADQFVSWNTTVKVTEEALPDYDKCVLLWRILTNWITKIKITSSLSGWILSEFQPVSFW